MGLFESASTDTSETAYPVGNHTVSSALDYADPAMATHVATTDGSWKDPATWETDAVPGDDARVFVEEDVTLIIDHEDDARLEWVRVDGTLRFSTDRNTQLGTETLVTAPGSELLVGTAEDPVEAGVTATIEFVDRGPIDPEADPDRVSKGLIPHSTVRMHGVEKTSFRSVEGSPERDDTTLECSVAPEGWEPGDTIVLAGVSPDENQDEELTIQGIDGSTVTVEGPLEYDHVPPRDDLSTCVANLDRNVRLQSETEAVDRRGHVMFMHDDVRVANVGFYDLGRTDKRRPFTDPPNGTPPDTDDPNPVARYACHFHRLGVDTSGEPSRVTGCALWGSPGWGYVNHHSYVEFEENVSYDVLGAGFVAEAGMEVGTYCGNFALRSEGSGEHPDSRMLEKNEPGKVDDFGHAGHGFWFQSPTVRAEDNVAAGHHSNAFTFWTRAIVDHPIEGFPDSVRTRKTVPVENLEGQPGLKADLLQKRGPNARIMSSKVRIRPFRNNTAFASSGGVSFERNHRTSKHYRYQEWSVIEGFTAYNIGTFEPDERVFLPNQGGSAIIHRFGRNLIVRDSYLVGRNNGQWGHKVIGNQGYGTMVSVENTTYEDWGVGVDAAHRDKGQYLGCHFDNDVDIRIYGGDVAEENSPSAQDIEIRDCTFATDEDNVELILEPDGDGDPRLGNASGDPEIGLGRADNLYDLLAGLGRTLDGKQLYFDEQAPEYVPIPDTERLEELQGKHGSIPDLTEDYPDGQADVDGLSGSNLIGMTNQELFEEYGIAVEGHVMSEDAVRKPEIAGGAIAAEAYDETWIDAGAAEVRGVLELQDDPSAASGTSLVATDRSRQRDPPGAANASYQFEVAGDGPYAIWVRLFGTADFAPEKWASTGFWIRLDDEDWVDMERKRATGSWQWHHLGASDAGDYSDPLTVDTYDLAAGTHTLDVGFKRTGARLDEFYITNNLQTVPVGPTDAGRSQ
jgi:hypothetical protein